MCYCIYESFKIDEYDGLDFGMSCVVLLIFEVYVMYWFCGNFGMSVLKLRWMDCFFWENFERISCDMCECVLGLV